MRRETQFKVFIAIVTLSVGLIAAASMILFGVVRFKWSDDWLARFDYKRNKDKERKILVIGDSQLSLWPMEHCLFKDLERFCDQNEIGYYNAAHPGFGPIEYEDRIKKLVADFQPDLVLMFYYTGNDLTDVLLRSDHEPKQPELDMTGESEQSVRLVQVLNDTARLSDFRPAISEADKASRLMQSGMDWNKFRAAGIDSLIIEYAKNRTLHPSKIGKEYVNPHLLVTSLWHPDYLVDNHLVETAVARESWYKVLTHFDRIMQVIREDQTQLAMVVIPSSVQVDTSHFDFYRRTQFKVDQALVERAVVQQLLGEFCDASGVPCLDLLPILKSQQETAQLYFENDDHLSEQGHWVAFQQVKDRLLIPFAKGELVINHENREEEFYRRYTEWAIDGQEARIRKDSAWVEKLSKQAMENEQSLDTLIRQSARYIIESR